MKRKNIFLKTKNKIDEEGHLKLNKIKNSFLKEIIHDGILKDELIYIDDENKIYEIFYNSLLNELDYILNSGQSLFYENIYGDSKLEYKKIYNRCYIK